jgi:hypothetical protein
MKYSKMFAIFQSSFSFVYFVCDIFLLLMLCLAISEERSVSWRIPRSLLVYHHFSHQLASAVHPKRRSYCIHSTETVIARKSKHSQVSFTRGMHGTGNTTPLMLRCPPRVNISGRARENKDKRLSYMMLYRAAEA